MLPGGMNLKGMGKHLQEMQKKLAQVEEDLKERIIEATAGGGMVTIKVNGAEEIVDLKIEPEVINPADKGMLEDLLIAAVNEGVKKARKMRETEMAKVAGLNIPGLF